MNFSLLHPSLQSSFRFAGRAVVLVAGFVTLVGGNALAADLGNPFPTADNLTQDEIVQISTAFGQALAEAKPGTVIVWKSADSGRSGQVRVLRVWDATAGHCAELEQRFSKGNKAIYEVPYCKGQDGTWKVTF